VNEVIFTIFTYDSINRRAAVEGFLDTLSDLELLPTKIGSAEPLRKGYTKEEAVSLWCAERDGCFDVNLGQMVGKTGSFMGKGDKPKLVIDAQWWSCPNLKKMSYVSIFFPAKTFKQHTLKIIALFEKCIELFHVEYGFITDSFSKDRQHVTGTPNTRISGVFWCNYFSHTYQSAMNCSDRLQTFPWWRMNVVEKGIITFLSEEPCYDSDNSNEIQARNHLGDDVFTPRQRG